MLVMFECTVVGQRLRNLRELRALSTPKQAVQVYRHGKWDRLPGDALLPGDLISLGRPAGGAHPAPPLHLSHLLHLLHAPFLAVYGLVCARFPRFLAWRRLHLSVRGE